MKLFVCCARADRDEPFNFHERFRLQRKNLNEKLAVPVAASGHTQTVSPATSAYRFHSRSSLSFLAGRVSMDCRLAAILVADVVGYS